MMRRFSAYGFLKNQRYFEPFLYLIFLEKGLSFLHIGMLVAVREITVVLAEVPSGALADIYGRRRTLILSFVAYIVSFVAFATASQVAWLVVAMMLFGCGDAFRTGTHKAMIFSWLSSQGHQGSRTFFYGRTRSWSKFGSAVSTILASLLVFTTNSYSFVFYGAIVPYLLGIVNLLGYPRTVEAESTPERNPWRHMRLTVKSSLKSARLRRLYLESMSHEGVFSAVKDYVQPVIKTLAVASASTWMVSRAYSDIQVTALAVAPVYVLLHSASAVASRRAHSIVERHESEDAAARTVWWATAGVFAGLTIASYYDVAGLVIAAFVLLSVVQNLWRPILIARLDHHGRGLQGATLLSAESQARRLATVVVAPMVGWAVDTVRANQLGGAFWPAGLAGLLASAVFLRFPRRGPRGNLREN